MSRLASILTALTVPALLLGCSSTQREWDGVSFANASLAGTSRATYELTPAELKLNCKDLTGRMQVRILQVRDYLTQPQSTIIATGMQRATSSVFGTSKAGSDPGSQYAIDRAMLEAYNARLIEKKCKPFALDEELKPKPVTVTPAPAAAAPGGVPQKKR